MRLAARAKLVTLDWSNRVAISLLSILIIDSCLLYSGASRCERLTQRSFYEVLSSQLKENSYDSIGLRSRAELLSEDTLTSPYLYAFRPQLSVMRKRNRNSFAAQRYCKSEK
eukprot:IDg17884t1